MRPLSEQLLLQAGQRLLATHALEGVRRLLSPKELEAASKVGEHPTVGLHSAYRLWPTRDEAVAALARHVLDPDEHTQAMATALDAYQVAIKAHAERRQPATALDPGQLRELFREVLAAVFHQQLHSATRVAVWLLQIAATTSSPLWSTEPGPGAADIELGRQVLEARSRCNDAATASWADLLQGAMALFGRRPRPGYTVRDIAQQMSCLFDGACHRFCVDHNIVALGPRPAVNEHALERAITRACDAIFDIAWAGTEPGLLADPRRPTDPHDPRTATFDRIVEHAAALYQATGPGQHVDLRTATDDAGEHPETATYLFPADGDLPDSVLRHIVGENTTAGDWAIDDTAPWIASTLHALSEAATSHPALIAAVSRHHIPPERGATGFVGELIHALTGLLRSSRTLHTSDPPEDARHLVALALEGATGWWGAQAALELAAARAARHPTP